MDIYVGDKKYDLYVGSTRRKMVLLPYDAKIEYLESSGIQYIDTGINLHSRMKMRVVFTLTNIEGGRAYCGASLSSNRECCLTMMTYSGQRVTTVHRGSTNTLLRVYDSNIGMKCEAMREGLNASLVYYNISERHEVNITQSGAEYDTGKTCYLFGMNGAGRDDISNLLAKTRIHEFQLLDGDVILADYVPVRIGQIGYMYDRVSRELFGNAGTGHFILGPDINN